MVLRYGPMTSRSPDPVPLCCQIRIFFLVESLFPFPSVLAIATLLILKILTSERDFLFGLLQARLIIGLLYFTCSAPFYQPESASFSNLNFSFSIHNPIASVGRSLQSQVVSFPMNLSSFSYLQLPSSGSPNL